MLILHIIVGWFVADMLSGVIHYLLDTFGTDHTPLIGDAVIRHSREHHTHPLRFTEWGFWDRHRNTWVVIAMVALLWWLLLGWSVMLAAAIVGGAITPSVHYWAHRPSLAPRWARLLQRWRVIQSPKHHSRHHAPPYRANYCVLTDWVNIAISGMMRL